MPELAEPRDSDRPAGDADAPGDPQGWIHEQRRISAISERYDQVEELERGYAYRYPAAWADKVRQVRDYLRRYYTYFDTEMEAAPGQPVWLRITGPDGTKEWLRRGLDYAAGRYQPDATDHLSGWRKLWTLGPRRLTQAARTLPDFLIIGAAKAGTTSLFTYLGAHPSVRGSLRKEVYFFDMNFGRGTGWYRAHFPTAAARAWNRWLGRPTVTGEATPCYLFDPRVPERVRRLVPAAKLVVLLRNPIDRAYSFYWMMARRGLEQLSFEAAIDREEERLAGELDRMLADPTYFSQVRHHHSYLARGHYADQLDWWLRVFPREQLLILTHDQLKRDRVGTVDSVVRFLGLEPYPLVDTGKRNFVPYEPMDPALRPRLVEYFRPHNQRLQDLLGQRLDWDR